MKLNMRKRKTKYSIFIFISLIIVYVFGVITHLFEKDFYTEFEYPMNGNIIQYVEQMKNNDMPSVLPINFYNFSFIKSCKDKCNVESLRLVIIVKSALEHFDRRLAIRRSFGYENRFSDVTIKTVFIVGVQELSLDNNTQKMIDMESKKYQDVIQAGFLDSYYNNTIKTMMGFKWAVEFCQKSKFYLFSDDDMYISIKNVLRFVRNPIHYPEYVEKFLESKKANNKKGVSEIKFLPHDYELPDDTVLYAGYTFESSPHRHKTSKWYVSLEEYPFHKWPLYISAGAYILSKEALLNLYFASFYTAHFRFDDIYLGILAKKMGIKPYHCTEFYFYKKEYSRDSYKYVIASHGYDNPAGLLKVWNEQKEAGNA